MQCELIVFLGEVNREIRGLVSKLAENSLDANHGVLPPGKLQALAEKLAQVAKRPERVSADQRKQEPLRAAISEYVKSLEALRQALGNVQDSLGQRRDRLKKDFEHLNSARAWVETFRATS